jgi:CDP-4-dehydro-6-deoxyglucose reductase
MATDVLTLWRAAQLVGVSRGVLQKKIRDGELEASDGLVSTEDLLRVFSDAVLKEPGDFDRVTRIKEQAFGRRVRERLLPSQDVLAQRLFAQSEELADVRRHLQIYHELVTSLDAEILKLSRAADDDALLELHDFVQRGLSNALATKSANILNIMDDVLKIMSSHVTVRPSGREFALEGHDTLLQAGLGAGLHLNYGCGNGTCGLCKARVISGEVARVAPYDYPLSEAEKLQGYTLLCAHTAASSEVVIETLEALGPRDIPVQQIATRVRATRLLGADTMLLHLQSSRTNRLRFLAGQTVTLSATCAGKEAQATYPIASCPCDDRNLQFYIGRDADDFFAEQLFTNALKSGDAVTVWGPQGDFVLADSHRPLVFGACDTGFAPMKGLIEQAMATDAAESISLYWLATRADGHFLANQCRAWTDALDNFDHALFTDTDVSAGARAVVQGMCADLFVGDCDFYLAGPERFVDAAAAALRSAAVPEAQIRGTLV